MKIVIARAREAALGKLALARLPLLAATLVAATLASCGGSEPSGEIEPAEEPTQAGEPNGGAHEAPAEQPSATVRWIEARAPEDRSLLEAPATAVAAAGAHAHVAPPFTARVVAIRVAPGDVVHAGDPLIDVSMPEVLDAAAIWISSGRRVSMREQRREQLEALREEGLVESGRVFEQEANMADVSAERVRALAVLRAAGVPASRAAGVLARGTITIPAPIDGIVGTLTARLGEVRQPGDPPMLELIGSAPVRIEARLPRALPEGAELTFVAIDGTRVPLRETPDASAVDPDDGTRRVWISPVEPVALADGLRGSLQVRLTGEGVVEVPARALGRDDEGPFVLRRTDAGPERVAVEVLSTGGGSAIVRGALAPGDPVTSDASALLAPPEGE